MTELHDRFRAVSATAESIFWRPPSTPAAMFRDLAAYAEEHEVEWDRYGERGAVEQLEARVAELLGKPAAVMFPSGVMAQQATLRAWCDRSGSRRVALPDLSHLLHHEQDGPRRVMGLELEPLTTGRETPTAEALAKIGGRLGAAMVELPLRDAGCLLPTWDELVELSAAARERGVPLHADGARIWESVPHWDKPLAEAAALFDSMYVSLYKGLGGTSGALVVCPEDLAGELRSWRQRMGGTIFSMTTAAVGGLKGLRRAPDEVRRLPRVGDRPRRRAPRARDPDLSRGAAHRDVPGVRRGHGRRRQRAGRQLRRAARHRALRPVARRPGAGLGRDRADLLRIRARARSGRGGRFDGRGTRYRPPVSAQAPSAVILVRATSFVPNPATAADNAFQADAPAGQSDDATSAKALAEMDALAAALRAVGVRVHVFDDDDHTRPDSVFPNNWLSTHAGGTVAVYPMYASNRRHERRADVLEMLKSEYRVQAIVDYSGLEPDGIFLEGTGAMVLDHVSRVAYTARSHRADIAVLERFCTDFNYEPMAFDAVDSEGVPVYHTNVIACVGTDVAMIALEMIPDETRREQVRERLAVTGRTIVELTEEQIREFAGNAVELCGRTPQGKRRYMMAMSARAKASLRPDQVAAIEESCEIVAVDIPTIELAGGSVRCMIAGVHLDHAPASELPEPGENVVAINEDNPVTPDGRYVAKDYV